MLIQLEHQIYHPTLAQQVITVLLEQQAEQLIHVQQALIEI